MRCKECGQVTDIDEDLPDFEEDVDIDTDIEEDDDEEEIKNTVLDEILELSKKSKISKLPKRK